MASFLRGKQTGIQKDLSATIAPQFFAPDEQERFGINSHIRSVLPSVLVSMLEASNKAEAEAR